MIKSSDGYCWPIGFLFPKVMRPHPEWPEGDQIREDGSCPQSIVSIAGLRSTHELGSAASAALFLMGRLNRDGRGWSADTHPHHLGGGDSRARSLH